MTTKTSEPASQRPVSPTPPSEPPKKPTIRTGVVAFPEQEKEELGQHPKTEKRSLSSKQGISRTKSKSEHTIDDEGEDINSTAVIGDAVVDLVTGDDEDESTTFVLCLAAAGVIFSIISYVYNKDNSDVLTGIYIFMAGYAVLLLRILPFWLTTVGIGGLLASVFASGNTTLLLWLSLALLGTGLLGYLIRYLVPQSIMRILKKLSWILMFVGPYLMYTSGADITGMLCTIVSALWFILFVSRLVISKGMDKVLDAAERISTRK